MEKGRANLSRLTEAPIAKVIKDILGLWEVDCGIKAERFGTAKTDWSQIALHCANQWSESTDELFR